MAKTDTEKTEATETPVVDDKNTAEARAKAKAEREAAAAERKAAAEARKAAREQAKAEKLAAKEAKKAEKEAAKEARKVEREANRRPQQNGVRRPKPDTLCGRVWELADTLSEKLGQPVPIGELMVVAKAQDLNPSNVRAEYASWKKYHGIAGRITLPKAEAPQEATA